MTETEKIEAARTYDSSSIQILEGLYACESEMTSEQNIHCGWPVLRR